MKLGYVKEFQKQIKPYYSAIFNYNKALTTYIFDMSKDKNIKCIIIIAIDIYGISIDNLNMKFIIQRDISLLFDSIIQRIKHVGKKSNALIFVFFISKQSKIKQSLNSNCQNKKHLIV